MPPQRTTSKMTTSATSRSVLVTRNTTVNPTEVIDISSDTDTEGTKPPSVSTLQAQIATLRQAKRRQHRQLTAEIKRLKQELEAKEQKQKKKAAPSPPHESFPHRKELYQDSETKRTALEGQYGDANKTVADLGRRLEGQRKKCEEGDTATHLEIIRVLEEDLATERRNVQRYANANAMHKAAHDKLQSHAEGMWRDLECPMCLETAWEPMVLNCGHVFCAACTRRLTSCGSCRAPIRYPAVKCYPLRQMTRAIGQVAAPREHSPRK